MDASTRPPQKRHRSASTLAAALVAILFATTQISRASTTEHTPTPNPDILLSTQASAHDIAITTVKSGSEGLELSARFTDQSQETVSEIAWTIRNDAGEKVFEGQAAIADATLPPGDYRVTARYGAAQILQGVTVHEGTKLSVSFILNAGALRILQRVKGIESLRLPSFSKVFASNGPMRGQLITTTHTAGEILKISAGEYRIESHFEIGNAVAVTDVKIKSGIMSAVNIDHKAGLLNLSAAAANDEDVQWTIVDEVGTPLPLFSGLLATVVLKPGHYKASVAIPSGTIENEFDISAGQILSIDFSQK